MALNVYRGNISINSTINVRGSKGLKEIKFLHFIKLVKCQHQQTVISYICIISYLEKPWKKSIQRDTLENTIDKSIQDLKKSLSNRGADKKKKKEKYKPRRNKEKTKSKWQTWILTY